MYISSWIFHFTLKQWILILFYKPHFSVSTFIPNWNKLWLRRLNQYPHRVKNNIYMLISTECICFICLKSLWNKCSIRLCCLREFHYMQRTSQFSFSLRLFALYQLFFPPLYLQFESFRAQESLLFRPLLFFFTRFLGVPRLASV